MNRSQPFRTTKILSSGIIILFLSVQMLYAQALIGVVDYMKVDDSNKYLELEKSWKKIHEERIKKDMIVAWSVFKVMFKTTEDPYNYITVSWYDSFSKLDKDVPEEILKAAFPNKTEKDWKAFHEITNSSRKLVSSGVFHQRLTTRTEGKINLTGVYYVINEINVSKGKSKEYLKILNDIYLPIYKEDIKNENRVIWSLWEKWPGNMKDFQYLAADGYLALEQIEPIDYFRYFNKLYPDKNADEISNQVQEIRELVNSEMWKIEYSAN